MKLSRSIKLFDQAQKLMVGGVNSPVRAFKAVGGTPRFLERGKGSFVWDADGNKYHDFVSSWGPLILGHADASVAKAIGAQLKNGWSFGASTELEVELATLVQSAFPVMEKMRFVSSGTEAVMSAIRLARGFTSRDLIIKFDGCYHGHSDSLLVQAGSGAATFGRADSAGVPSAISSLTLSLPYNDIASVQQCFAKFKDKIAAVIVEPVAGNMGLVLPQQEFLKNLRKICTQNQSLLIFDEVISGFRLNFGGAQSVFGIRADLTCLGKIVGGGLPVGAFGGDKKVMDHLAPLGGVYQAGTLSGNPLAMVAGIATLSRLKKLNPYKKLEKNLQDFALPIQKEIDKNHWPLQLQTLGSMMTLFFAADAVTDFASAQKSDRAKFAQFFQELLKAGIYWPSAQLECAFISCAHTPAQLKICSQKIIKILKNIF